MDDDFRRAALDYHRLPQPGKLRVEAAKRLASQRDQALAGVPGALAACAEIVARPLAAAELTIRANAVGVVSNGSAVPGLGSAGPLAAKPLAEGKAALLRQLAGIDAVDLEIAEADAGRLAEVIATLEPSFGAISLVGIEPAVCSAVEVALAGRLSIPVLDDERCGTAIVIAALVQNAMLLQGKRLEDLRLVACGAEAALFASLELLISLGLRRENVTLVSAQPPAGAGGALAARLLPTGGLGGAVEGADLFLGMSAPRLLKPEWLGRFAGKPVIVALADPEPEILPEAVRAARPDAIVATARADYPNQVCGLLCAPFLFRGALDVGAGAITPAMQRAAAAAIAALARAPQGEAPGSFGSAALLPKPFDPRLLPEIAEAVARAAMAEGAASRPVVDFPAYRATLERRAAQSGQLLQPLFARAKATAASIAYAEGEDERVLRAVQQLVDDDLAHPILIGRRDVIERRVRDLGLRIDLHESVEVIDPGQDEALLAPLLALYQRLVARHGVPPSAAARRMRTRTTVVAAMLAHTGRANAALCGGSGDWWRHMQYVLQIVGRQPGVERISALSGLILPAHTLFVCDTHMNPDPTVEQIVEMTLLAASAVRHFGIEPKIALLSHSSFGSSNAASARRMREALVAIRQRAPELVIDGEMHADAALRESVRARLVPESPLPGAANLLIMPGLDAASIAFDLLKAGTGGLAVGPLLLGMATPVHVLPPSISERGILNTSVLAAAEALRPHRDRG
jgi:malate dehydrogenase (oxaloacetate-decarboxylating)(NADP+)